MRGCATVPDVAGRRQTHTLFAPGGLLQFWRSQNEASFALIATFLDVSFFGSSSFAGIMGRKKYNCLSASH
jgi:hypothetical protein